MRQIGWAIGPVLAVVVIAAIAFGAYEAGRHHAGDAGTVIRVEAPAATSDGQTPTVVVERGYGHHWGFFPGFFFLPVLFLLFFFFVFRGGWGGRWRRGRWDVEEWHRRQHEPGGPGGTALAG